MTERFVAQWYDPPEGWRYGFPKPWPNGIEHTQENLAAQLKVDGYPEHAIPVALDHTRFGGRYVEAETYEAWMTKVDAILTDRFDLMQSDLPDWLSRDAYESGMTPDEGADACLTACGWYDKEDDPIDEW